jgi:predicted DCC family thiol-disulfide oxidoreductase YuxK
LLVACNRTENIRRWLLYDGECGFCQHWVQWARRRGAEASVTFQPCQRATELRRQAGISDSDCEKSAFFLELAAGRVIRTDRAAGAINRVLAHLPGSRNALWRWLSVLYRVPGIQQFEELGYRLMARWRGRFGRRACARK